MEEPIQCMRAGQVAAWLEVSFQAIERQAYLRSIALRGLDLRRRLWPGQLGFVNSCPTWEIGKGRP
jgi:hypothetical protein